MRPAILALTLCTILNACATSLAPTLPSHATPVRTISDAPRPVVAASNAVAASGQASSLDLGALAQIVARLPHDLYRFEIDLFVCAGAIVAIGIVNAFLIASLLATRRRAARAAPASEAVASPVVVAIAEPVARACSCGAPIGARSKTGRCRQCATASRSKRSMREATTAPG